MGDEDPECWKFLTKYSQAEIAKMNNIIVTQYGKLTRNSIFWNGLSVGDYCLATIRREFFTRRKRNEKTKNKRRKE